MDFHHCQRFLNSTAPCIDLKHAFLPFNKIFVSRTATWFLLYLRHFPRKHDKRTWKCICMCTTASTKLLKLEKNTKKLQVDIIFTEKFLTLLVSCDRNVISQHLSVGFSDQSRKNIAGLGSHKISNKKSKPVNSG